MGGHQVLNKLKKFMLYYSLGLLGLELLVLFDRLVFGSKELLPSKTEMIVVALIFLWLIWKEDNSEKVDSV